MFYNKALLPLFIRCTLQSDAGKVNWCTYVHNEKVQPAPVVGEVFPETVGDPLQSHFQDEDVGEDLVCIFKHHFDHFPLFNVNVFKCLSTERCKRSSVLNHMYSTGWGRLCFIWSSVSHLHYYKHIWQWTEWERIGTSYRNDKKKLQKRFNKVMFRLMPLYYKESK